MPSCFPAKMTNVESQDRSCNCAIALLANETRSTMGAHIRLASTAAGRALNLLRTMRYTPNCPCHASQAHHQPSSPILDHAKRSIATPGQSPRSTEYAFEMAASSIRFGPGCTKEVGMDLKNMGAKKVCVVTDVNVGKLDAMRQVIEGLTREGVDFTVYERTMVEPKDSSYVAALGHPGPLALS